MAFDGRLKPFMVKRQFARESDNGSLIILFLVARGKTEKEKTSLVLWLHQIWAGACSIISTWCYETHEALPIVLRVSPF
jgi:hypothetical protein